MRINGVSLQELKIITNPLGDIYHAQKKSEIGFNGFGEAYFSTIAYNKVKGWKMHKEMQLNLVVPVGIIKFVIYDAREKSQTFGIFEEHLLSLENYKRLSIEPGLWVAFQGMSKGINLLLNIASIEHDPSEAITKNIEEINYDW